MVKVEVRMLKLDLIFITWNGIFVLPLMGCQSMAVFTSMEWGTLRVKCLIQEHNTITLTGWENDISWCYLWFPLELTSEKGRNSKLMFMSLPRSGYLCLWLSIFPRGMTNCLKQSDAVPRSVQWYVVGMEHLFSFFRHHYTGKPMAALGLVSCFMAMTGLETRLLHLEAEARNIKPSPLPM